MIEAEMVNSKHQSGVLHRVLPAVAPVLLISIGYVDPGKWVATIEGGAQFGVDLVTLMLIFNFVSILCQCLSARIGIVTGRDLAQICGDEYDKWTCLFLGVQAEFSVIALDLTIMLGVAHGLNLIFGVDLSTCVFLTAIDAALFALFASFLENRKANLLCVFIAGSIMLFYVIGVLISQPEFPLSMNGMLTKLSGESAFTVMSILGANIMPHNFYLHSSLVQQHRVPPDITKSSSCHDHFLAIIGIFSGIYLVNYVLMNSAANVFNSTGLVLLTFLDALSLMEQVIRSPVSLLVFSLVLFCSNQITALTWNIGGQSVINDFLRLEIPGWLHRATIRIIAAVPALYCVCTSGAEGVYQLLMFTQVMVALLLPSSVIPLFRIASSRPIMGVYKISQFVEFLVLIIFMGMLGLKIIFIAEMIFGNSDWVSNLRWNMGNSTSIPYFILLITACSSFGLMLWLAATPLKSASTRFDKSTWGWDVQKVVPQASVLREENDLSDTRYYGEEIVPEEQLPTPGRSMENQTDMHIENFDRDLPEKRNKFDQELHLTTIEENNSSFTFPSPPVIGQGESISTAEAEPVLVAASEVTVMDLSGPKTMEIEITEPVEKTMGVEGDLRAEKDDDLGDSWEAEESSKEVPGSISSLASDGPSSFRSLSGKSDEGGNGAGSLSRLAGLGRAARRQLAAILDDFWRQLYDLHGQVTPEARAKKMDVVLGVDSKAAPASLTVESSAKELSGYSTSLGGRGCDSVINPSLYDSPKQQRVQHGIDSSYGVQRGSSSLWSNNMQLLDVSCQNSSPNAYDSNERRYSSLRSLPSSVSWDYQPATVHGYQIASHDSHLNRLKERTAGGLHLQIESSAQSSRTLVPTNYRDSLAFALGQNGMSATPAPGFQSHAVSRISSLQSESPYYDVSSSVPADNPGISANTKKYHSLPDISLLSDPYRDSQMSDKSLQWNNSFKYGTSVGRTSYDPSFYANTGSRAGAPLTFDELSPSKAYREPLSFQLSASSNSGSLWFKQPFEQFGVADKNRATLSDGMGSRSNSVAQETTSVLGSDGELLQSLRLCVIKLLKLEGSDWLFTQNDGADEDLIDRVAARERFLYEVENRVGHIGEPHYLPSDRMSGSALKDDEAGFFISSVPHCGEGCIWKPDLVISFGVWCIHRILDLTIIENRPELWGKYTYVLNRLQGIIDPAFSKPRSPMSSCFCLQIPASHQQRSSPPVANGMLPPAAKPGRGKCTTAGMLLDTIKDVELAISCRKGRSGTAAGDVAFPKGKENLASVMKRYKRRLSNKPAVSHEGSGLRRVSTPGTNGS